MIRALEQQIRAKKTQLLEQ
jgi:hypothetical protein